MSICVTTIFTAIAGFKYRISTIQILIEESAEKRAPSTEKHIKKMKWWKGHDFHFGFIRIGNVIATHKMRNVEKGGNWWVENAKKHIFKSFVNISLHSLSFSLLVFHLLFLHWLEKEGFRFSFLSLRVIYTNALRRHSQLASQNLFLSSAFCSEYFMVPPKASGKKLMGNCFRELFLLPIFLFWYFSSFFIAQWPKFRFTNDIQINLLIRNYQTSKRNVFSLHSQQRLKISPVFFLFLFLCVARFILCQRETSFML